MFKERTYTVGQFNKMIKEYLESSENLQEFFLEGELSGVTYYKSGHLYFNLKDKNAQVKCVAFNYKFKRIVENLKNGDFVRLFGDVGFYENRGDFQVLVRHIEKQDNLGEMFKKLEELKIRMEREGYFSENHKKPLPKYPRNIGVVTAFTGAAVHDIINTVKKRDSGINIYVYPAKVQGIGAKEEIIKGIEVLNKIGEIDFIIAGRGGGSIEDLWAFNEEETALAFFKSKKPIISAVGHEIDNMLTDLTADRRASTPTQAIEISIPERGRTINELNDKVKYIKLLIGKLLENQKQELQRRKNNYYVKNFRNIVVEKSQIITERENLIKKILEYTVKNKKNELNSRVQKLIGLNPLKTLKRGYLIGVKNGKAIKKIDDVTIGDEITLRLQDGKIKTEIKKILPNKN